MPTADCTNKKVFIFILIISFHCLPAISQYRYNLDSCHFDSIRFCHDAHQELKKIALREFAANMEKARLISFNSADTSIRYHVNDRTLSWKGIGWRHTPDSISLQLTPDGVVFCNGGKTTSVPLEHSYKQDTSEVIFLETTNFLAIYNNGRLQELQAPFGFSYAAKIDVTAYSGSISWDVYLKTTQAPKEMIFLITDKCIPVMLTIEDDLNKVGVMLSGRNGILNHLTGRFYVKEDLYGHHNGYQLRYSRKGRLKRNKWKAPLHCD